MALYLQRNNNLADVENVNEARRNLGIGSMALLDSNNVHITGGTIKAKSFTLLSSNAKPGRFLVCSGSNGQVDFSDVSLGSWIYRDTCNIRISEFDHADFVFLNKNSLCNIAFTADYSDIEHNKPSFFSDLSNDLDFLYNDLRNIDVERAISNLGIGSMAFKHSNDAIFFKELHITSNVFFTSESFPKTSNSSDKFFCVDASGKGYWTTIPIATTTQYGVIKTTDNFKSTDSNTVPSINALADFIHSLNVSVSSLDTVNVSSSVNVIKTIQDNGILLKDNHLSDLANKAHARSNLGFDTNMERFIQQINSSNTFSIGNLVVNSNMFFQSGVGTTINELDAELIENAVYLAVNSDGNVIPRNFPFATTSTPGFVYLLDEYDYTKFVDTSHNKSTVLSARAFDQFVRGVYLPLYHSISNSVEPRIRELFGDYLHVRDNLLVENPSVARQNLQLHPVAHTGDYFQLENRPTKLSQFDNDVRYLVAQSNLSDLTDVVRARSNLGIGSFASYDSNAVHFVRGNGSFSNLHVHSNIVYKYDDTNHTSHFLQCLGTTGECVWSPLPEATHVRKGIVRLESDYRKSSDRAASSAAALYTMYHRLMGEIDVLQREVNALRSTVILRNK